MTRAAALFQIQGEDAIYAVGHGEFIGRSGAAALTIDDPRISEAHAMVSLRGRGLEVLALRGKLRVRGNRVYEAKLSANVSLELAPEFFVTCVDIILPEHVLALDFAGLPRVVLTSTLTLYTEPEPRVRRGFDPRSAATIWNMDGQWRIQISSHKLQHLEGGETFELGQNTLSVTRVPVQSAGLEKTMRSSPVLMQAHGGSVKVWREQKDECPIVVSGVPGKIGAVLLEAGGSLNWRVVVGRVWPGDQSTEAALRGRFDAGVRRLRERLVQLGLPPETVRLDGAGSVILIPPGDHV